MSKAQNKKLFIRLGFLALFMFGFAYLLVPLYNTLCRSFGINGKPDLVPALPSSAVVLDRDVQVEFLTTENKSLPWKFIVNVKKITVHPGASARTEFYMENRSNRTMTVQAIPSITPGIAAKYFKKTECFCFTQQTLKAHEGMNVSLLFHLDPKLPEDIHTLTLGYTLFDVTDRVNAETFTEENKS